MVMEGKGRRRCAHRVVVGDGAVVEVEVAMADAGRLELPPAVHAAAAMTL